MLGRHRIWDEKMLLDIRESYLQGESQKSLAERCYTSQKTISWIVSLKAYRDIGVPEYYRERLRLRKRKGRKGAV